ncbi:3-isopropylmalate dehydratase small subunit [Methanopyrus kandleri]|uniref:3-isopropylmalate dehydratase small subunit 2 n=1 Tax=Methanopyrus kandleri (strain AV19 / DSM 6324 / JCM 9639 / NBRC 100938) TaxID=190192 RepID=LEUD2_METKA|nr:3-isopropylmalate dehydratase small subunit [Methanopyrus kandleri]Q8TW31.1 RecName: Full=3-isopropylmalate dehydratase small subunit 2; AltName: Full=Alpha-IPM isomerase 2; Short=IPMI 2; AltName: Full=Isopropylmalate isomerase 2 [Methanopyrus kandleri AV19]AAM02419.1 3-isopropylmalate dehydratase small subunit [Methanopyrus kandleri AV19]
MRWSGRAHVFGDDVDTDQIIPGRCLRRVSYDELGRYAMTGADPEFPEKVREGDVIVAGKNFGCGSSREQAVMALQQAGVACVVARSFARIFYRNAINRGLPTVEAEEDPTEVVEDGNRVTVDLDELVLRAGSEEVPLREPPEFALQAWREGGLLELVKKNPDKPPWRD